MDGPFFETWNIKMSDSDCLIPGIKTIFIVPGTVPVHFLSSFQVRFIHPSL